MDSSILHHIHQLHLFAHAHIHQSDILYQCQDMQFPTRSVVTSCNETSYFQHVLEKSNIHCFQDVYALKWYMEQPFLNASQLTFPRTFTAINKS